MMGYRERLTLIAKGWLFHNAAPLRLFKRFSFVNPSLPYTGCRSVEAIGPLEVAFGSLYTSVKWARESA